MFILNFTLPSFNPRFEFIWPKTSKANPGISTTWTTHDWSIRLTCIWLLWYHLLVTFSLQIYTIAIHLAEKPSKWISASRPLPAAPWTLPVLQHKNNIKNNHITVISSLTPTNPPSFTWFRDKQKSRRLEPYHGSCPVAWWQNSAIHTIRVLLSRPIQWYHAGPIPKKIFKILSCQL